MRAGKHNSRRFVERLCEETKDSAVRSSFIISIIIQFFRCCSFLLCTTFSASISVFHAIVLSWFFLTVLPNLRKKLAKFSFKEKKKKNFNNENNNYDNNIYQHEENSDRTTPPFHAKIPRYYPMWCMPIDVLLSIDFCKDDENDYDGGLKPSGNDLPFHEELLAKNMLVNQNFFENYACIYVSHEWLSHNHPDPFLEKIQILQKAIRNLVRCKVEVRADHYENMIYRDNTRKKNESDDVNWSEILKHCLIWFDYFSVPQLKENEESRHNAICSIPSYISQSEYFFVLSPTLEHKDKFEYDVTNIRTLEHKDKLEHKDTLVLSDNTNIRIKKRIPKLSDRYSWISNGWNRLENLILFLCNKNSFLIESATRITFRSMSGACTDHVGGGSFACCDYGHVQYIENQSKKSCDAIRLACDKVKMYDVISSFIEIRIRHDINNKEKRRFVRQLQAFTPVLLSDLCSEKSENISEINDHENITHQTQKIVENFIVRYFFDSVRDHDFGWSPLRYACIEGNFVVAKKLIEMKCDVEAPLRQSSKYFMGFLNLNIFAHVCAVCNSNAHYAILDLLSESGANVHSFHDNNIRDGLVISLYRSRSNNHANNAFSGPHWFLSRYPDYDVNTCPTNEEYMVYLSPIQAHLHFSSDRGILQMLLEKKATLFQSFEQCCESVFHTACESPESNPSLFDLLHDHYFGKKIKKKNELKKISFGPNGAESDDIYDVNDDQFFSEVINMRIWHPWYRLLKLKIFKLFAQTTAKEYVSWVLGDRDGSTCLMLAAYHGKDRMCQWLLDKRADPFIKHSSSGQTALTIARSRGYPRVINVLQRHMERIIEHE